MSKGWIAVLVIIGLLFVGGCSTITWGVSTYNKMVGESETVDESWSQVENVYQRRSDLIPNLVETVKGYATHEKSTFEAVIEARAKATQTTVNVGENGLDPKAMSAFIGAQDGLSSALSKLMVVVEAYPELKANTNFLELQAQLEGTENRIAVERRNYNKAARVYNTHIKLLFPSFVAKFGGFEAKPYFEAQEGAEKAPEVKF